MAIVGIPFDGRVFNHAVHAVDMSVRPRVVWLVRRCLMLFAAQIMSNRMGRE
jgi:hypothetical protein